jgi:type VI secretion system FHA domain protein
MSGMIALSVPELMGALASRAQFKDHLRLNQTMVRARDNNPLKFCQSTEEALEHMLLNDHPGLLHGQLALQEAFRELATHQTALVAALQPSLRETLEQLSPHNVEVVAGSESTAAFALPKGKGKLWDTYLEIYKKLAESERGTLEEKFMRSLGKYYERSLTALK